MRGKSLFMAVLLPFFIPQLAHAQVGPAPEIGTAVNIVNRVTAADVGLPRPLVTGDGVRQNEMIETGPQSLGELRLKDDTKLALGPGARLKLDRFVYDPEKSAGTIAVDLAKGAFRFITGHARKPSYLIRGPNAAITVRGTIFDVYIDATGTMWLLLHEGSIEVCNSRGQCREVTDPCAIVRVGGNGDLSEAAPWNRQPAVREIDFAVAFPFVVQPPQIDLTPRFTRVAIEAGSCVSTPVEPPKTRRAEAVLPVEPPKVPQLAQPPLSVPQPAPKMPDFDAPAGVPANAGTSRRPSPVHEAAPARASIYDGGESVRPVASPARPGIVASSAGLPRWSGFYLGLTGGGAWMDPGVETGCSDANSSLANPSLYAPNDCEDAKSRQYFTSRFAPESAGFTGGGVAGFNVQTGSFVAGLETDMSWSSVAGHASTRDDVARFQLEDATVDHELKWLGTVRGRAGYAVGNWLLFGTGGLAFGEVEMRYAMTVPQTGGHASDSQTKTMAGWTIGTGAELSLGAFSVKGELLHFDLGEETLSARGIFASGAKSSTYFEPEFETKGNIARIGLNFHLN